MGTYKEVEGDLIKLALEGNFDVITHGVNCFCKMGSGIAPQMAKAFGCDKFYLELTDIKSQYDSENEEFFTEETHNKGDINKLGQIDYRYIPLRFDGTKVIEIAVVNSYTQFKYGKNHPDGVDKPLDYEALTLCFRKINHVFKGKHVGLPTIGSGLAGGDWNIIKKIIQTELKDCDVTVVLYKK